MYFGARRCFAKQTMSVKLETSRRQKPTVIERSGIMQILASHVRFVVDLFD